MRFTLKQLVVFEAVARLGSVTKAADEIALSQSATSMALGELETGLRVQLFDRHGKRLTLNGNGKQLMLRAHALLNEAREIDRIGLSSSSAVGGALRIVATETFAEVYLPDLCAAFLLVHPEVQLFATLAESAADVIGSITNMTNEIGFVEGPCNRVGVRSEYIGEDHMLVFAAAGHPLSRRGHVEAAELFDEPWVLREQGAWYRTQFLVEVGHRRAPLHIALESNSNSIIRSAVAAGVGLGCLPYSRIEDDITAGRVSLIPTSFDLRRSLLMLTRENLHQGAAATAFAAFAREKLPSKLEFAAPLTHPQASPAIKSRRDV